ncbi:MAG: hypothetical protein AB1540_04430 [Bdellovibrionota bacterium]
MHPDTRLFTYIYGLSLLGFVLCSSGLASQAKWNLFSGCERLLRKSRYAPAQMLRVTDYAQIEAILRRSGKPPSPEKGREVKRQFDAQVRAHLAGMGELQKRLEETFGSENKTGAVFYPSIGTDSAFPVRVFPGAEVIVGVDIHPFLTYQHLNQTIRTLEYRPGVTPAGEKSTYRYYRDLDFEGILAPKIIGSLTQADSHIRILSVTAFSTGMANEVPDISWGFAAHLPTPNNPVHGLIEFDHGAGTKRKTFIVIQGFVPTKTYDYKIIEASWWYRELMTLDIQAVIIKAASGSFEYDRIHPLIRQQIVSKLQASRGILLQGESQLPEESPSDAVKLEFSRWPNEFAGSRTVKFSDVYYGYSNALYATKFE